MKCRRPQEGNDSGFDRHSEGHITSSISGRYPISTSLPDNPLSAVSLRAEVALATLCRRSIVGYMRKRRQNHKIVKFVGYQSSEQGEAYGVGPPIDAAVAAL